MSSVSGESPKINPNAAQQVETTTHPLKYIPLMDIWRMIFEYGVTSEAARTLTPLFEQYVDQIKIKVIRESLKGSQAFINALANCLSEKEYPDQIKSLRELANRCGALEKPNAIDASMMLATVTLQTDRLKSELIDILSSLKPEDLAALGMELFDDLIQDPVVLVELIKSCLPPETYSDQIKSLTELAERAKELKDPKKQAEPSTAFKEPKEKLAEIVKTIQRAEWDMIFAECLKEVKEKFPSFLKNIIDLAKLRTELDVAHADAKAIYFDRLNQLNEPKIAIEWISTISSPESQKDLYEMLVRHYSTKDPALALELMRNAPDRLRVTDKIPLQGTVIDESLQKNDATVWSLLIPPVAPLPTVEESTKADQDLNAIKSLLEKGAILEALELAQKRVADIDPDTKALKFPKQCMEFIGALLAVPKDKLAVLSRTEKDQKASSAAAATTPAKASEPDFKYLSEEEREKAVEEREKATKPLKDILEFMVTYLPDGMQKHKLLSQAIESQFFSSLEGFDKALLNAQAEQERRGMRLFRLAQIFIKDNYLPFAFEVAGHIQSPDAKMHFIISLIDNEVELTSEQEKEVQNMIMNLPDEHKYMLILHNKEKPNKLIDPLIKDFNLQAFKQQAEKELTSVLTKKRIGLYFGGKKELSAKDIRDFCILVSKMDRFERDQVENETYRNDTLRKILSDYNFAVRNFKGQQSTDPSFLAAFLKEAMEYLQPLPAIFKIQIVRDIRGKNPALAELLDKEISENERKEFINADEEYRNLMIVSDKNPLLDPKEVAEWQNSDFLVHSFANMLLWAKEVTNDFESSFLRNKYFQIQKWSEKGFTTMARSDLFPQSGQK